MPGTGARRRQRSQIDEVFEETALIGFSVVLLFVVNSLSIYAQQEKPFKAFLLRSGVRG